MKKFLTITSRSLFVLVLLFCIFKSFTILADTTIFQITKIEVKEKSEGVVVNDVSLSNGQLNNDIIFSQKDEFIKYNITIKNNTNDDYTVKTIADNNESTYLEYTYDNIANTKVEGKSELTFELQIKYVNEASGLYISNEPVSLTLTYEKDDGTTSSETITDNTTPASDLSEETEIKNPNTGDNLNIYIIIGLISLAGLGFTFVNKKSYFKTLMFIGLFSILAIPFGAKADSEKFVITFTTNKIQNTSTDLISGPEFNLLMHKLSLGLDNLSIEYFEYEDDPTYNYYNVVNNDYTDQDNEYWIYNEDILAIERATDEEYESIKDLLTEENIVSTSESNNPAYMWFDDSTGTIYYYSTAKVLVMNEDSSFMFTCIGAISNLDLSDFDTINVNNMRGLFSNTEFNNLNLGENFDTSNVTDMSFMINGSISELNLGDKFDTSKVTNMSYMFTYLYGFTSLDLGNKFDTSNVTDMSFMFAWASNLTELNLGNKFDTSKVTNMMGMFTGVPNLEELDLGNKFNTSNVTNMMGMFYGDNNLQTIYVSSDFDLSSLEVSESMFGEANNLVGEQGTSYSDICNNECIDDATYARIDDPENSKPGYFTLGDYSDEITYSQLISGPEFNLLMHKLSSGNDGLSINKVYGYYYIFDDNQQYYNDYDINYIERASKRQYNAVKSTLTDNNIISTTNSDVIAYMWYDSDSKTIYYYSSAKKLVMNEDSSAMFASLPNLYELYLDNNFDTSKVTDMGGMFHSNLLEYLDLGSNFDTSNVTNMKGMFLDLRRVQELDLGDKFDTSKVTDMSDMFASSDFEDGMFLTNLNLGDKFDTSNVTNMYSMFMNMNQLQELDLGEKFDTSKVTSMSGMFMNMNQLQELDLGEKFDTSNVTNMESMFHELSSLQELNLGDKFDTSKVTNMYSMFSGMNKLETIYIANDFDLSSLVDEYSDYDMFNGDYRLIGGNGTTYDSNYTNSLYARADYPSLNKPGYFTLNTDEKTTSNLISGPEFNIRMKELSTGSNDLLIKYWEDPDGHSSYYYYSDENDTNVHYMKYYDETPITRVSGAEYMNVRDTLTSKNIVSTSDSTFPTYMWYDDDSNNIYYYSDAQVLIMNEDASFMFANTSFNNYDLESFDTSNVTNMSYMFSYIDHGDVIINFGDNFDTSNVTNMSGMFADSGSIQELNLGNKFDTSKVTDMSYMFHTTYYDDESDLTSLNLGSKFDTSNVTNMSHMFYNMYNLEELNLGDKFDTSKVTDMSWMFAGLRSLQELNLGNKFDTSNVTNMMAMFDYMPSLVSLDLGDKFNTSKVTDMSNMFIGLNSLQELDLGNKFNTSNVTNMSYMFYDTNHLTELNLGDKFDTSNVTDMYYMFGYMTSLKELNLGAKFNTSNVTNMSSMFAGMNQLTKIYTANDFDLSSLENDDYMFSSSTSLIGGAGTAYDENQVGSEYARIDDPEHGRPGYFTRRSN